LNREVVFSLRAGRQLDAAFRWWRANRDKNPDAFDEAVADSRKLLAMNPCVGKRIWTPTGIMRRILLEKVRYYLYYRVTEERVEVISVWHSSRRPPRL
jgi:plasmid stabilization system protein ParE